MNDGNTTIAFQRCSNLQIQNQKEFSRGLFHSQPNLTKSLSKIFVTNEIRVIESSSNYKIKNHFETTKTKIPEFERSGIYQISKDAKMWLKVHRTK
jgi:hypothetical protein